MGRKALKRLCSRAKDLPNQGQLQAFYALIYRMIALYRDSKSEAGKFARSIGAFRLPLHFLWEEGVKPTNNHAECTIRYAVLSGANADWELNMTRAAAGWSKYFPSAKVAACRNAQPYTTLAEAFACYFKGHPPRPGLDTPAGSGVTL